MTGKRRRPPAGKPAGAASNDHQAKAINIKANDLTLPRRGTPADVPDWVLDLALGGNVIVRMRSIGLVAVPDTVMIEGVANGHAWNPGCIASRGDGRTVSIFALREDGGAR